VVVDQDGWPDLRVQTTNTVQTEIVNDSFNAVPVVIEGDIPISGDLTISAATTQDTPLWVTNYGPIGSSLARKITS